MKDSLAGRRIVVTGASSGIGEAIARSCVDAGGTVALVARRKDRLNSIVVELGDAAQAFVADVRDEGQLRAALDAAARFLGGVDALVNAAGLNRAATLADGTVSEWREMLETNLLGAFVATHSVLPHMRAGGLGDIVNVSSMAGRRVPGPESGVYSATKAGMHAWSEALGRELGPEGIRVMVLSPGIVRTEFASHTADESLRAARIRLLDERGLDPRDVAKEVVHMLALPRNVRLREVAIMPTTQLL